MAYDFVPQFIQCPANEVIMAGSPVIVKIQMYEGFIGDIAPALIRIKLLTPDGWVEFLEDVEWGHDMLGEIDIHEIFDKRINPQIFFNGAICNPCIQSKIEFTIAAGVDISKNHARNEYPETVDTNYIVFGDPVTAWAVCGGFSNLFLDYLNGFNNFNALYCAAYPAGLNKFLTSQPDNRKVSPTMSNRLYFYAANVAGAWKIAGKVTFADAHEQPYAVSFEPLANNINSILAGLGELVNQLDPGHGNPTKYTVQITIDDAPYGELRTYIVDNEYYEEQTLIFVENSKGAYDAWWFTGQIVRSGAYTFSNLEKVGTYINGGTYGAGQTVSIQKFRVNTGSKSKAEMRGLQDAILRKGFIMPIGGILIPGFIASDELVFDDTMEPLHSAVLELVLGYKERYWDDFELISSTVNTGGAFSDGFNNGFFI